VLHSDQLNSGRAHLRGQEGLRSCKVKACTRNAEPRLSRISYRSGAASRTARIAVDLIAGQISETPGSSWRAVEVNEVTPGLAVTRAVDVLNHSACSMAGACSERQTSSMSRSHGARASDS
jgi:hypothetical protein